MGPRKSAPPGGTMRMDVEDEGEEDGKDEAGFTYEGPGLRAFNYEADDPEDEDADITMSNTIAQATCPHDIEEDQEEDNPNPPDPPTDPSPFNPDQRLPPVPDDHAELTEPVRQQARTLSRDLLHVASGPRTDADLRRAGQYVGSALLTIERSQRETEDRRLREREQEEAERVQRERRKREQRVRTDVFVAISKLCRIRLYSLTDLSFAFFDFSRTKRPERNRHLEADGVCGPLSLPVESLTSLFWREQCVRTCITHLTHTYYIIRYEPIARELMARKSPRSASREKAKEEKAEKSERSLKAAVTKRKKGPKNSVPAGRTIRRAKGQDDDIANKDDSDEEEQDPPGDDGAKEADEAAPAEQYLDYCSDTDEEVFNRELEPEPSDDDEDEAHQQASQVDLGPTPEINELRDRALQLMWDITHLEASKPEDGDLRLAAEYQGVTSICHRTIQRLNPELERKKAIMGKLSSPKASTATKKLSSAAREKKRKEAAKASEQKAKDAVTKRKKSTAEPGTQPSKSATKLASAGGKRTRYEEQAPLAYKGPAEDWESYFKYTDAEADEMMEAAHAEARLSEGPAPQFVVRRTDAARKKDIEEYSRGFKDADEDLEDLEDAEMESGGEDSDNDNGDDEGDDDDELVTNTELHRRAVELAEDIALASAGRRQDKDLRHAAEAAVAVYRQLRQSLRVRSGRI
ncbi:unnamed protein product [Zymoseptoria tritici ST99CH_3D7]|uniref:Uncharacterized protein n=1 Tax=Zymoseptoria tritici (strain ST99CH_3D7) TaxID=1276538 RepID=A0A1X7RCZ8_ZYMT9|nr:unnamed protein product [Zymoseptoria tritici ST99CH_3D7]